MRKFFFILLLLILFHLFFILYPDESLENIEKTGKADTHFLILVIGISIIAIVIAIIKIKLKKKKEIAVIKGLDIDERRKYFRNFTPAKVRIKQKLSDGGYKILEFKNRNMSKGGVFILTENLIMFDLGEELEIIIKDGRKNYFEGKALVIHSEAIFNNNSIKTESGYGIMFL